MKIDNQHQRRKIQKHFNGISQFYYDIVEEYPFTSGYYHRKEFDVVMNIVKRHKPERILDVGCATGKILKSLKRMLPNSSFYGCDISSKMLKIAKDNNYSSIQADITNLPFKDNSFDFVYTLEVLEHLPNGLIDVEKSIEELFRVATKKGIILLEIPNKAHFAFLWKFFIFLKSRRSQKLKNELPCEAYEDICIKTPLPVDNAFYAKFILKILSEYKYNTINIVGVGFFPSIIYEHISLSMGKLLNSMDIKLENKMLFKSLAREFLIEIKIGGVEKKSE